MKIIKMISTSDENIKPFMVIECSAGRMWDHQHPQYYYGDFFFVNSNTARANALTGWRRCIEIGEDKIV